MNASRRCAALSSAAGFLARPYFCETLEKRVLLSDGPPVLVLTERFSLTEFSTVNVETVSPWLWKNPDEFHWNLDDCPMNNME